jgi:preprotein translocase subunit SecE
MANKSKKANANKAGKEVTEEVIQAESKVEETKKPAKKESKGSSKSKSVKQTKSSKDSFFKSFKAELKKVTWPTFKQLVNNTAAVIAMVLIIAAVVFVLDFIFESINGLGINRLRTLVSNTTSSEVVLDENANTANVTEGNETVEANVVETENTAESAEDANTTSTETEVKE